MSSIQSVIARLYNTEKPARSLDNSIGEQVGWTKQVHRRQDEQSGKLVRTVTWRDPKGLSRQEPPEYTADLQAAYELINEIDAEAVCAVTFDGTAQVLGSEPVRACTIAVAMCIIALMRLQALTGRA